jgi:hypothetical protein
MIENWVIRVKDGKMGIVSPEWIGDLSIDSSFPSD